MMALEDLTCVFVLQRCGCGAGDVKEQIYSYGEICGVDESCVVKLHEFANSVQFPIPTGGTTTMFLPRLTAASMLAMTQSGVVKSMTTSTSRTFSGVRAAQASFSFAPAIWM